MKRYGQVFLSFPLGSFEKITEIKTLTIKFNISAVLRVICSVLLATQLFFIGSPDQASNTAIAQTIGSCVVEAGPLCTRDLNPCGNASFCECPKGYSYDDAVGTCLIRNISEADSPGMPVRSKCGFPPNSICTLDINVCGNASICACPDGTIYSPITGQCIIQL